MARLTRPISFWATFALLVALNAIIVSVHARMEISLQDDNIFHDANLIGNMSTYLAYAHQLGATRIRMFLFWQDLHSCREQSAIDAAYANYVTHISAVIGSGIKVEMTITGGANADYGIPFATAGTPGGDPGPRCSIAPLGLNPSPSNYAAFVKKWVPQFAALGVDRFSLWNEPNYPFFLCAGSGGSSGSGPDDSSCNGGTLATSAALYRKLYTAGYKVIEGLKKSKACPKCKNIKVFIGELAGAYHGEQFMDLVLKKGQPLIADGFSTHPYQYCNDPSEVTPTKKSFPIKTCTRKMVGGIGYSQKYQAALTRWAQNNMLVTKSGKKVDLYLTEFGYHRGNKFGLPESLRAKWYVKAMNVARAAGARQMSLYMMVNLPITAYYVNAPGWNTGIVGTPAFTALRNWAIKHGYKVSQ